MPPPSHPARWLALSLLALAGYAAWVRGGTPPPLQGPLPVLGALVLVAALCAPAPGGPVAVLLRWLRDPFFYAGLLFLALLAAQWWNAGRHLYLHPLTHQWGYTPASHPGWPSAFTRTEAAEMLRWFFPAWAAGLAVRSWPALPGHGRWPGLSWLLRALAASAALLALFGIVQQQSGTGSIYWLTPLDGVPFFASFGYRNHAGAYFVLMSALSAGLLVDDALARHTTRRRGRLILDAAVLLLNLFAAHLACSRAGILLAWVLIAAGLVYVALRVGPQLTATMRVNAAAVLGGVLLLAAMLIAAFSRGTIQRRLATLRGHAASEFSERMKMNGPALQIWRDSPWFGVGGYGYRYLFPYTTREKDLNWIYASGKANVHNDPLQFLAEFGVVGAGLLLVAVGALLRPLIGKGQGSGFRVQVAEERVQGSAFAEPPADESGLRSHASASRPPPSNFCFLPLPKEGFSISAFCFKMPPLPFFILLGALLVWIHSLVDLPFRCPAILIAWVTLLAAAGLIAGPAARKPLSA